MNFNTLEKSLDIIGRDLIAQMIVLLRRGKGNTKLERLIKKDVIELAKEVDLQIRMPDYAMYVNDGRRPGKFPPPDPIAKWCKKKGIDEKFIYSIQKSIYKNGIKPLNFLDPFYEFSKNNKYKNAIATAAAVDVAKQMDKIIPKKQTIKLM